MSVLADLRARLTHHTCPGETCGDLLCGAAREIEALTEKVGHLTVEEFRLRQWLCPHRDRMKPDRGNDDGSRQCADCAGIILDPERVALERAERAEDLVAESFTRLRASAPKHLKERMRALLADLDARRQS